MFDCFPFGGELELLRLRLELLDDVVDHFVLAEAPTTFSGIPKPLFYQDHRDEFAAWNGKIIHVVVDDMPVPDPTTNNRWPPERFQRRALTRGLADADPDDLVLISDVDELIDPTAVSGPLSVVTEPVAIEMTTNMLRANWHYKWHTDRARAGSASLLGDLQDLRDSEPSMAVRHGGAHFSYLMDRDAIIAKLAGAAHDEFDTDVYRHPAYLDLCLRIGYFPLDGVALTVIPVDQLDPVERFVFDRRPDLFDFELPLRSRMQPVLDPYLALRQRRRFPAAARRLIDEALLGLAHRAEPSGRAPRRPRPLR